MKNRFFGHPNESNIKETGEHFCLHDAVIAIDNSDVRELMDGAENAIVLQVKQQESIVVVMLLRMQFYILVALPVITICFLQTRSQYSLSVQKIILY